MLPFLICGNLCKSVASMATSTKAHRDYHPAKHTAGARARSSLKQVEIPKKVEQCEIKFGDRTVKLTNLNKLFWPELKITKRDLIQYYADVAPVLLPHLQDRAMVMKRYPNGAAGEFFFMKRAPSPRPPWIELCSIHHGSGNVIDFPIIQDVLALLTRLVVLAGLLAVLTRLAVLRCVLRLVVAGGLLAVLTLLRIGLRVVLGGLLIFLRRLIGRLLGVLLLRRVVRRWLLLLRRIVGRRLPLGGGRGRLAGRRLLRLPLVCWVALRLLRGLFWLLATVPVLRRVRSLRSAHLTP